MKRKVLTWFAVLILISVAFSISTTNVSAEEPPEPDNDKNIYLRPGDPGITKNYDYNYSSDIYSYTTTVGDSEDSGWPHPNFVLDNQVHLTVNVEEVMSSDNRNSIHFYVTAQGAYETNYSESFGIPSQEPVDYVGTTHVPIEAEITDMEGRSQYDGIEEFDIKSNTQTGNNISLDEDEDADPDELDMLMDILKFQAEARKHAVLDVQPVPGPDTVLGTLEAADEYLHPHIYDREPHPSEEDQDWAPYETFQKTWPLDYKSYGGEFDSPNSRSFSVAAGYHLIVDRPLPNSLTLEFSARNILDIWIEDSPGSDYKDVTEGAEASVEIPIKNAEPEIDENSVEVTNEPVEAIKSGDEYELQPNIDIGSGFLDNPAGCTDAEYDIEIEYSEDGNDWDTYDTYEGATINWSECIDDKSMDIDGQGESGSVDLKFIVTAGDEYGAWEKEAETSFTWELSINELTISTNTNLGGTTDPSPGTHEYTTGEVVEVSAISSSGWEFSHWSGDIYSTSSTTTVEMDEDKSITANFEQEEEKCPICGGPIGSCGCGGPGPGEEKASLEHTEYEQYLEEGPIALELFEELIEEGIDDLDREAELSPAEEGWFIQQDGEKRYWIRVTEEKLEIYALEESAER